MNSFRKYFAGCIALFVWLTLAVGCVDNAEQEALPSTEDPATQEAGAATSQDVDPATRQEVEQALERFATVASSTDLDTDKAFAMLQAYLREYPQIYGAAFAFAPQGEEGVKSAPYVFRQGDTLIKKDLIDSYDYTAPEQTWYVTPVETNAPVWTDPYFDEGGGDVWMVTYAIPVYAADDATQLVGVATSDVLVPEAESTSDH